MQIQDEPISTRWRKDVWAHRQQGILIELVHLAGKESREESSPVATISLFGPIFMLDSPLDAYLTFLSQSCSIYSIIYLRL